MAKESKDFILSLGLDILNEIKENEKYAKSKEGKEDLIRKERQIESTKESLRMHEGVSEKDLDENTKALQNEINQLSGEDYWFTVSDGFESYRLSVSAIKKMGDSLAPYILSRWKDSIDDSIEDAEKNITLKADKKKNLLNGLWKLRVNVKRNIELIRDGETYEYIDKLLAKERDKPYPIFQDVNYLNIQINI